MAKVLLGGGGGGPYSPSGGTVYFFPGMNANHFLTTEAAAQRTMRDGGKAESLWVRIITNTSDGTNTYQSRINGGNGALNIAVTAAATGIMQDLTNIDNVVSGDLHNFQLSTAGTTGSMPQFNMSFVYTSKQNHVALLSNVLGSGALSASTTYYWCIAGRSSQNHTTEASVQVRMTSGATIKKVGAHVSAHTAGSDSTMASRINGANGAISVTFTAGGTGFFEDLTNSDVTDSSDDVNFAFTTPVSFTSITVDSVSCNLENTKNSYYEEIGSLSSGRARTASGTMTFQSHQGNIGGQATEANAAIQHRFSGIMTAAKVYVSANTYTGTSSFVMRKNGVTEISANITAGATGLMEATGTLTFNETDLINSGVVDGTSGSMTTHTYSVLVSQNLSVSPGGGVSYNSFYY